MTSKQPDPGDESRRCSVRTPTRGATATAPGGHPPPPRQHGGTGPRGELPAGPRRAPAQGAPSHGSRQPLPHPEGAPGEGSGAAAPRARQGARGQAPAPAPDPRLGWGLRAPPAPARPHSPHRPAPRSCCSSLPCWRPRGCPRDRIVPGGAGNPWHSPCRGLSCPLSVCLSVRLLCAKCPDTAGSFYTGARGKKKKQQQQQQRDALFRQACSRPLHPNPAPLPSPSNCSEAATPLRAARLPLGTGGPARGERGRAGGGCAGRGSWGGHGEGRGAPWGAGRAPGSMAPGASVPQRDRHRARGTGGRSRGDGGL